MASKHIGRRVNTKSLRQTTSKKKSTNTPWLKNAMRSIGAASLKAFEEISPNFYDVASTSSKGMQELGQIARGKKNTAIVNALKNNVYVKTVHDAFKTTISDVKKGNFYNPNRADEKMMESFGGSDTGTFFDDWDDFDDWGDDDSNTNVQINNYNQSDDNGFAVAVTEGMRDMTVSQLKGQKAQTDALIAISSARMAQSQELGNQILGHLDNISSSLSAINEFNNSTMMEYIQASTAYMERMGGKDSDNYGGGSSKFDINSIFDRNGQGIKSQNYLGYVKQNITKQFEGSMLGFAHMTLKDFLPVMLADPVGMMTKMGIKAAIPKQVKNSMKVLDDTLAGVLPTLFSRLAGWGDANGYGPKDTIKRYIGKIFGVRSGRKTEFDLSGKITNEATPFDKVTRHTINEIIPKYLRESTAYLKFLTESFGGNSKRIRGGADIFDRDSGGYTTVQRFNDKTYKDIRDIGINTISSSKFGSALTNKRMNLKYRHGKNKGDYDEKSAQEYDAALESFFEELEKHGKYIDPRDLSDGSAMTKILDRVKGTKGAKVYLKEALKSVMADNDMALSINPAIQQANYNRNKAIESLEADPEANNLWALDGLTSNIDKSISEVMKTTFGDTESTKKNGTVSDIMSDIRFLLNRGINVRIAGRGAYKDSFKIDSTGYKSENVDKGIIQKAKDIKDAAGKKIDEHNAALNDNINEKDAQKMLSNETDYFSMEAEVPTISGTKHLQNFLTALAFGKSNLASAELQNFFGEKLDALSRVLEKDFLSPMKKTIFGEKDKTGYSKDGLFSGVQNSLLDTYRSFTHKFNGKGYINSKGEKIEDAKDSNDTIVGNIKNTMSDIKNDTLDFMFGEKDKETGKRRGGHGFLGFLSDSLKEGFEGWKEAFFGDDSEKAKKLTMDELKKKVSDALPATVTGGLGGLALGAMSGGSILGTLIGGPVGGAVLGGVGGILSRNEKFQDWLFGKKDDNGERMGGFVSKKVQDAVKKNKNMIVGGATVGMMKSLAFGHGGGLLGALVGGPLAGAIIGGGLGFLTKTDLFHDFLFGKEGTWQRGVIPLFNSAFKKAFTMDGENVSGKKLFGMNILGAAGGAMTAAMVGKMGLLGAAMTPFGPIGGALAGLALSMKASEGGFKEWLFGKEELDENGNPTGKKTGGVLHKFAVMLDANVFTPFKNGAKDFMIDTRNFLIDKVMAPIEFAIEPFAYALRNLSDYMTKKIKGFMETTGKFLKKHVLDPIVSVTEKFIVKPFSKVFGFIFKAFTGISKMIISQPFNALALATNFLDARDKRASRKRVMRENRQDGFRGLMRNIGIRMHFGDMRDNANYEYYEGGYDRREFRQKYLEDRKLRRQQQKEERKRSKENNYNTKLLAHASGFEVATDTVENRERAQEIYNKKRIAQGKSIKQLKFKGEAIDHAEVQRARSIAKDPESTTNDYKAPTESRMLGGILGIFNFLRNRFGNGDPKLAAWASGKKMPHPQDNEKEKTKPESKTEEDTNGEGTEAEGAESKAEETPSRVGTAIYGIYNKFRKASGKVKYGAEAVAQSLGLRGFASGGTSEGELAVVGENGSELAMLPKGTQVFSHNNPIPVVLQEFSPTAAKVMEQVSGGAGDAKREGVINSDAHAEYEEQRDKGKWENIQKKKAEEKDKEERKGFFQSIKDKIDDLKNENHKHHKLWSFIFSKKGLLTGTFLLALPKILKFFSNFKDNIANLIDIAKSILSGIGEHIGDAVEDIKYQNDNLTNDESSVDRAGAVAKQFGGLLHGDVGGWVTPNGKWDHASGSKINSAIGVARLGKKYGASAVKVASKANKAVGAVVDKGIRTVGNYKAIKQFGNGSFREGAKLFKDTAESYIASGQVGAKDAAAYVAKENGMDGFRTAASGKGIIGIVTDAIKTLVNKLGEVIAKHGGKVGTKLTDMASTVIGACKEKIGWLTTKIEKIMAGVPVKAIADLGFITIGAINGATGAARLFYVDQENVDGIMIAISTVFGAFKGSITGSIIDLVNELSTEVLGVDFINQIALAAYDLIVSASGQGERYDKLRQNIDNFRSEYESNKKNELDQQYQAYLNVNGLTEADMTFDEFVQNVEEGGIKAQSTSYADYNAQQHQTLGYAIGQGLTKMTKGVGKAFKGVGSSIFGSKETTYIDQDGYKWVEDPDQKGMYEVFDGKTSLGKLDGSIMESRGAKAQVTKKKGIIGKAGDAVGGVVKGAFGMMGSGLSKIVSDGKEAASAYSQMKDKITENYNNKDMDFKAYINADVTGLKEDNMFHNIINNAAGFSKAFMLPGLILSGIGKKIAEKLAIKIAGSSFMERHNQLMSMMKEGDLNGLTSLDAREGASDTAFGWLGSAVTGFERFFLVGPTAIKAAGNKIGEFMNKITNSKTLSDIAIRHEKLVELTKAGDVSGLYNFNMREGESDNPIGWLGSGITGVERGFLGPLAGIKWIGNQIGNAIGSGVEGVKNFASNVKKYIKEASKYTDPKKDITNFDTLKLDYSDSPISQIAGALLKKIMGVFVGVVRYIRNIPSAIGDTIGSAANGAKNWVVDKVDSAATYVMNMGRGGKGGKQIDAPYYSQNDPRWKDLSYGNETMGNAGCGPDAFAMAASAVNRGGRSGDINPVEVARYAQSKGFRDQSGTNWNFVNSAAKSYGMSTESQFKPGGGFIQSQLNQGHPVILSGQGSVGTPFTSQGHYVVATGTDSNGNVIINDPRGANYSGKYPMSSIVGNANMAWGMKKGGRGLKLMSLNEFSNSSGKVTKSSLPSLLGAPMQIGSKSTSTGTKKTTGTKSTTWLPLSSTAQLNAIENAMAGMSGQNVLQRSNIAMNKNATSASFYTSPTSELMNATIGQTGDSTLSNMEEARTAVASSMRALEGRLHYSQDQSKRSKVMDGFNGTGSGDCSSTVYYLYKNITGLDVGTYTGAQINSSTGVDVDNTPGGPPESKLLPGDCLYFRGKSGGVGHVAMYIGNGQIASHGGPNWDDMGPQIKNLSDYCAARQKSGGGYMKTRRFIHDGNVSSVTLPDANGLGLSSSSSGSLGILGTLGSFFTQFATKGLTGLLTGNWDTNYDWGDASSDSNGSSSSYDGDIVASTINPGEIEKSTYKFFLKNGFTPAAAAGVMGNIKNESGFKPGAIESNGKGPAAGLFQWMNWKTKSGRWSNMNSYAQSKGKSWTDAQSQLEFALKEMMNDSWMWSKAAPNAEGQTVSSFAQFKALSDPVKAAEAFSNHFERPGKPRLAQRRADAKGYYNSLSTMSLDDGTTTGTTSTAYKGIGDLKRDQDTKLSTSAGDFKRMQYGNGGFGGFGGDEADFEISDKKFAMPSYNEYTSSPSSSGGFGVYKKAKSIATKGAKAVRNTIRGGRSGAEDATELLQAMIGVLEKIAAATMSSDEKLNLLKKIQGTSNQYNLTKINTSDGKSTQPIILKTGEQIVSPSPSRSQQTATSIAKGF